jgi:hypothetical protein
VAVGYQTATHAQVLCTSRTFSAICTIASLRDSFRHKNRPKEYVYADDGLNWRVGHLNDHERYAMGDRLMKWNAAQSAYKWSWSAGDAPRDISDIPDVFPCNSNELHIKPTELHWFQNSLITWQKVLRLRKNEDCRVPATRAGRRKVRRIRSPGHDS